MNRMGKRSNKKCSRKPTPTTTDQQPTTVSDHVMVLVTEFCTRFSSLSVGRDEEAQLKFCNETTEFMRNIQNKINLWKPKMIQDSLQPPCVDVDPSFVEEEEAECSDVEEEKLRRLKEKARENKETQSPILSNSSSNSSTANDENGNSGKTSAQTDHPFVTRTNEDLTNGEASTSGFHEDRRETDRLQIFKSDVNSNGKRKSTADSSSLIPLLSKRLKTCSQILKCKYDSTVDILTNVTIICDRVNTLIYRLHNYSLCNIGYVVCPYCENEENNRINVRNGPLEEHPSSHTNHPTPDDSQGVGGEHNENLMKIDERMDEILSKMRKKAAFSVR